MQIILLRTHAQQLLVLSSRYRLLLREMTVWVGPERRHRYTTQARGNGANGNAVGGLVKLQNVTGLYTCCLEVSRVCSIVQVVPPTNTHACLATNYILPFYMPQNRYQCSIVSET